MGWSLVPSRLNLDLFKASMTLSTLQTYHHSMITDSFNALTQEVELFIYLFKLSLTFSLNWVVIACEVSMAFV